MRIKLVPTFLIVCVLFAGCQNNKGVEFSSGLEISSIESSISSSTIVAESKPASSSQSSSESSKSQSSSSSEANLNSITSSSLLSSNIVSSSEVKEDVSSTEIVSSSEALSDIDSQESPISSKPDEFTSSIDVVLDAKSKYQDIFDTYSEKIKNTTPNIVKEYKKEAASNTEGLIELDIIRDNKLDILAKIYIEGAIEINNVVSDGDSEAKIWDDKLKAVYMKECNKIHDAHDAFAKSVNYYGEFKN